MKDIITIIITYGCLSKMRNLKQNKEDKIFSYSRFLAMFFQNPANLLM